MRVDLLLCRLRLAKTRSRAQQMAQSGLIRCNGVRVVRASHAVSVGDIVTLPAPGGANVIGITALPERRGPPAEARSHYRELDQHGETAIAGDEGLITEGIAAP